MKKFAVILSLVLALLVAPAAVLAQDETPVSGGTLRAAWQAREPARLAGVLQKYARLVGPAHLGAVTHAGACEWPPEPDQRAV